MQCPKCGFTQDASSNCASCGINVGKYKKQLEARRKESAERSEKVNARVARARRSQQSNRSIPWMAISIIIVIGLSAWMLIPNDSDSELAHTTPSVIDVSDSSQFSPSLDSENTKTRSTGLAARLESSVPTKNPIERARNATVFIQTAWGTLGSGFMINRECDVITNRHVMDQHYASKNNESGVAYHVLLEQYQNQIYAQIEVLQTQKKHLLEELSEKNIKVVNVNEKIDKLNRLLRGLPNRIRSELNIGNDASSEINTKVSLVDGTTYDISSVEFSEKLDLAMFRLPENNCPFLKPGKSNQLSLGTPLYTIGSPSGLTYTVTSGIFSGFREDSEAKYLQTDAPINPGNSGGPLITKNGRVIGINTSILTGTEGIGFSLPIEYVFSEF